jgi:electron transport complex protein RnfD
MKDVTLVLTTSPFLRSAHDTRWIMWQVNLALLPIVLAAVYFFGMSALLIVACATAGAVLPEWLLNRARGVTTVTDGSAVITGVLVGLTLPPSLPLWMAFAGGSLSIVLGKLLFGGLGQSVFNPALVGRAFLQAAFPEAMTTWSTPSQGFFAVQSRLFAPPFLRADADTITSATPLAQMKFEGQFASLPDLLFGTTSGSIGETAGLLILIAGAYLALRRVLNWRIPLGIFITVYAFGAVLQAVDPVSYPSGLFHLFAGGLMLGAVFMATDPVTSPNSHLGCWVFAVGIGILVVVIRMFGGLPEGVMYAILLMNAVTPLINRATQPRTFGSARRDRWK